MVLENSSSGEQQRYDFSGPETDVASINYNRDKFGDGFKDIKFIYSVSDSRIEEMMNESGVERDMNGLKRAYKTATESVGGKLDFSVYHLSIELAKGGHPCTWNPETEIIKDKGPLFLLSNQSTAYNLLDARNWLWGNSMGRMGWSDQKTEDFATGYNKQDSNADLRAIQDGFWYSKGYRKPKDCVANECNPNH